MKSIRCWKFMWYLFIFLVVIQISILYKWNWFCTNLDPKQHVQKMCNQYQKGLAEGLLCSPMCHSSEILSLQCYAQHASKETVFDGTWGDTKIIFKSAATLDISALHWYDNGVLKYPSEKDFISTIRSVTRTMLNQSLPSEIITRLATLHPRRRRQTSLRQRHIEMDNIWVLIQDNEYLLSVAFWENDAFPQLIGTCGNYFVVEYIEPIANPFSIWYDKDTKQNWKDNLKLSLLIMELIEELENNFKEPLYLCDVKFEDFGLTRRENGRVKVLDLDAVYPKSIINRFIKNINFCDQDNDCKFLDCRGRCEITTNKCSGISNNNLQIVCEKLFLGWKMSNRVLLPGLLLSHYAPDELVAVLRQCANPASENGIPRGAASEDMRKLLYGLLVDIDESLNIDPYLL